MGAQAWRQTILEVAESNVDVWLKRVSSPTLPMRTCPLFCRRQSATFFLVSLIAPAGSLAAQSKGIHPQPPPVAQAVRLTSGITIDGKLDEEVWRSAPAITQFRQS